jgi:hypothetical protein
MIKNNDIILTIQVTDGYCHNINSLYDVVIQTATCYHYAGRAAGLETNIET